MRNDLDENKSLEDIDTVLKKYYDRTAMNPLSSFLSNLDSSFEEYSHEEFLEYFYLDKEMVYGLKIDLEQQSKNQKLNLLLQENKLTQLEAILMS